MKSKLLTLFILTTLVLGAVCVVQWQNLRARTEQIRAMEASRAAESATRDEQDARLKQAERARAKLERDVQEFTAVTAMLRASSAQQTSNVTALAEKLRAPGEGNDEPKDGLFGKGMGDMLAKMMKDPAMREMMRGQQKAAVNMMYAGLFKELNLPPEQKDKLMETLLDSQMKNIEAAQGLFGGDKGDSAALAQTMNDQKQATEDKIKTLLGEEKFAQYQDYQQNLGERMQLDQLRTQFASENLPLQDQQAAQLLQIMKEEKARMPPTIPDNGGQVPGDIKGMLTGEKMEQQLQWMEDYNRRVQERAKQVLTPEQSKEYADFQERQASMQKFGLKMAKEMFGADKTAPTPPAAK